jgi:hypothetical protein
MASYTRLGSYLLASDLTADPSGKIARGLSLAGSAFDRHHLVRTFSEEITEAGFSGRIAEIQRVAGLLAGSRGFGTNYHVEAGRPALVACDYIPGRSLAQVLKKTREEQVPLGVDHALSVIQGLSQSLLVMSAKDLHHGSLSTHSIWVSFEGASHLIDAPFSAVIGALLPKARILDAALSSYRAPGLTPLQQDLYALGAILFELLTLDKLPAPEAIPGTIAKATLTAAQEEGPIPQEIQGLLRKLLVEPQTFASYGEFNKELERVLYDGDYSPTTFNMAFFMHTLFREESDQDAQAMKADQGADFTPFLPTDASARSIFVAADGTSRVKYFVFGAAVVVGLFAFMAYNLNRNSKTNQELQAQIAQLQQEKAANDNKLADISKQEEVQLALQDQLTKKEKEAKTTEEKAKAKKDLEEAKAKAEDLARQKDEALRKKQELAQQSNAIVQKVQQKQAAAPAPAPAPVQPPPVQVTPAPAPAPTPAPAPKQAAAPAPAQEVVETPPSFQRRATPIAPRVANKNFLPGNLRDSEVKVSLRIFVDAQGRAVKVMIVNGVSGPFGYNDAAQKAALESTYNPATRNGKPSTGWLSVEYNFGRAR